MVAVGQGGVETLQQHHAGAAAEHGPRRFGVEGAAVTIRRNHAAFLMEIAALLREGDRDAARERHIGAVIEQALASFRDGKKRGRTRRLHGEGGTAQIELVSGPRREEIGTVADQRRKFADLIGAGHIFEPLSVRQQMIEKVSIEAAPGVDRDLARKSGGVVTGAFQSLPGDFQKDPLLRVGQLRLARQEIEEAGIEQLDSIQNRSCTHIAWLVLHRTAVGVLQLLLSKMGDRFHAAPEIVPKCLERGRAREAAGHADHSDRLRSILGGH